MKWNRTINRRYLLMPRPIKMATVETSSLKQLMVREMRPSSTQAPISKSRSQRKRKMAIFNKFNKTKKIKEKNTSDF